METILKLSGAMKSRLKTVEEFSIIGSSPSGQPLYRWVEDNGTVWEEFWRPMPGGGLIQTRQVD